MIWAFVRAIPGKLWLGIIFVVTLFAGFSRWQAAERRLKAAKVRLKTIETVRKIERETKGKTDAELIDDLSRKP